MPKRPNCTAHMKMYKCTKCGNQFREFFKENTLKFVLSAHNGGLGKTRATKETMDRPKTYQEDKR